MHTCIHIYTYIYIYIYIQSDARTFCSPRLSTLFRPPCLPAAFLALSTRVCSRWLLHDLSVCLSAFLFSASTNLHVCPAFCDLAKFLFFFSSVFRSRWLRCLVSSFTPCLTACLLSPVSCLWVATNQKNSPDRCLFSRGGGAFPADKGEPPNFSRRVS